MTLTMVNQPKQNSVVAAVGAYGKRLSAFIRSRVRSVEDAEDILQDVWYQLSNVVDLGQIEQLKIMGFAAFFIAAVLGAGWLVMVFWNAVLPATTHFGALTYWQAVQLLLLCRILFGGFGGGGWQRKKQEWQDKKVAWREKMMSMTPEERADFKAQWRKRGQDEH
jgi:hypothetical protein